MGLPGSSRWQYNEPNDDRDRNNMDDNETIISIIIYYDINKSDGIDGDTNINYNDDNNGSDDAIEHSRCHTARGGGARSKGIKNRCNGQHSLGLYKCPGTVHSPESSLGSSVDGRVQQQLNCLQ